MQIGELHRSLPSALAERTRLLGRKQVSSEGDFVLYWMRTAIRTDENPALNVAIEFANQLGLPLLVYQGLSERYPFASDRHHTFVLQGARDVQLAIDQQKHFLCLARRTTGSSRAAPEDACTAGSTRGYRRHAYRAAAKLDGCTQPRYPVRPLGCRYGLRRSHAFGRQEL